MHSSETWGFNSVVFICIVRAFSCTFCLHLFIHLVDVFIESYTSDSSTTCSGSNYSNTIFKNPENN